MALRVFATGILVAGLQTVPAAAPIDQGLTIHEAIARHPGEPIHKARMRELMPLTLEEMAIQADTVIVGTIETTTTYLPRHDQTALYTDYAVTPTRVVVALGADNSPVPAPPPRIVITRWGGRTQIDGVSVTVDDVDLRQFRVGEELLLFLDFNETDQTYRLVGGDISGVFAVENSRVRALVKHPRHEKLSGLEIGELEYEVRRLRAAGKR